MPGGVVVKEDRFRVRLQPARFVKSAEGAAFPARGHQLDELAPRSRRVLEGVVGLVLILQAKPAVGAHVFGVVGENDQRPLGFARVLPRILVDQGHVFCERIALHAHEVADAELGNAVGAEKHPQGVLAEPGDLVEGKMDRPLRSRQIVLEAEVVKGPFLGVLLGVDLGAERLAGIVAGAAVGLEIADQVGVASGDRLPRHELPPAAFRIPEAPRREAQQPLVGLVGEADRPEAVFLGEIRQHRVRVGRAHELAAPLGDRPLELRQHVGTAVGDLVERVSGRLEDELHVGELGRHRVQNELVALADHKLIAVRRQVSVVEVGVKNHHVLHGRVLRWSSS